MSNRLSFRKPVNRDAYGRFQPYPTPPPPIVPPYSFCKHCNEVIWTDSLTERPYGYYFCNPDHVYAWRNEVQSQDLSKLSGTALSDYNMTLVRWIPNSASFQPPEEDLGLNIKIYKPYLTHIKPPDE